MYGGVPNNESQMTGLTAPSELLPISRTAQPNPARVDTVACLCLCIHIDHKTSTVPPRDIEYASKLRHLIHNQLSNRNISHSQRACEQTCQPSSPTMARTIPDLPRLGQPAELPTPNSSKSFWHSEPSPLLLGHRSTRDLPATADVVIIGSGITGTSIARHLLKRVGESSDEASKPDVVMLEAREACWGATGRVRPQQTHSPIRDSQSHTRQSI